MNYYFIVAIALKDSSRWLKVTYKRSIFKQEHLEIADLRQADPIQIWSRDPGDFQNLMGISLSKDTSLEKKFMNILAQLCSSS